MYFHSLFPKLLADCLPGFRRALWVVAVLETICVSTATANTERLGDARCYIEETNEPINRLQGDFGSYEFGTAAISALASSYADGALVRIVFEGETGATRVLVLDIPLSGGEESFVFEMGWDGEWLYYEDIAGKADFFGNELSGVLVTQSGFIDGQIVLEGAAFDAFVTDYGSDQAKDGGDDRFRILSEGIVWMDSSYDHTAISDLPTGAGGSVAIWVEPSDPWEDSFNSDPAYGCGAGDDDDYDEGGCGGDGNDDYDDGETSQGCEGDPGYEDDSSGGCQGDDEDSGNDDDDSDGCVKDAEASSHHGMKFRKPRWQRRVEAVLPFVLLFLTIRALRRRAV